jgi:hypothetical protein
MAGAAGPGVRRSPARLGLGCGDRRRGWACGAAIAGAAGSMDSGSLRSNGWPAVGAVTSGRVRAFPPVAPALLSRRARV